MNRLITRQQISIFTALFLTLLVGCGKPSPDEIFQEGSELMGQQNFVSARHRFQEVVDNYPDYDLLPNAKFYIGDCCALDGQLGKARTTYEELVQSHADSFIGYLAHVRLGDMAKEEGRLLDAETHYGIVIADSTDTGLVMKTRTNLADAYIRAGSSEKAVQAMKEMVTHASDPRSKLQSVQYLANFLISQGSPEAAWESMISIKDATEVQIARDAYYLSVRQTGIATRQLENASRFFDEAIASSTDDEDKSRALYNKALVAAATTISRATGIQLLEELSRTYPKTRWGRWAEVDAAKTIMTASNEFENPKDRVGELLKNAMDNYDDIIADTTIEWFEPERSADAHFQVAVIQVMRGQWMENVDDLKSASATFAGILTRFESMPRITEQARMYLGEMAAMVNLANASGEEFWQQLRLMRQGIDPFAKSASAEAAIPAATEGLATVPDSATGETKN